MTQPHLFMQRDATFSPDGMYRYTLWRRWNPALPCANFICLNPSRADAERDDNTSVRCVDFAARWGYGSTCITNMYAYCATNPEEMKRALDPIGPNADKWLTEIAAGAGIRIAAWGAHGTFMDRERAVLELLPRPLHCLTLTKGNHPHHPLRLSREATPQLWLP